MLPPLSLLPAEADRAVLMLRGNVVLLLPVLLLLLLLPFLCGLVSADRLDWGALCCLVTAAALVEAPATAAATCFSSSAVTLAHDALLATATPALSAAFRFLSAVSRLGDGDADGGRAVWDEEAFPPLDALRPFFFFWLLAAAALLAATGAADTAGPATTLGAALAVAAAAAGVATTTATAAATAAAAGAAATATAAAATACATTAAGCCGCCIM